MSPDRRVYGRSSFLNEKPVLLCEIDGERHSVYCVNISRGGICFEGSINLNEGDKCSIIFKDGTHQCERDSSILRRYDLNHQLQSYGASFTDVHDASFVKMPLTDYLELKTAKIVGDYQDINLSIKDSLIISTQRALTSYYPLFLHLVFNSVIVAFLVTIWTILLSFVKGDDLLQVGLVYIEQVSAIVFFVVLMVKDIYKFIRGKL